MTIEELKEFYGNKKVLITGHTGFKGSCGVFNCVTTQGPASITVHGMFLPSAPNTEVIPIFFPISPDIFVC